MSGLNRIDALNLFKLVQVEANVDEKFEKKSDLKGLVVLKQCKAFKIEK